VSSDSEEESETAIEAPQHAASTAITLVTPAAPTRLTVTPTPMNESAQGVPSRDRPIIDPASGRPARAPIPTAPLSNPTPDGPSRSTLNATTTNSAVHSPRVSVLSPLASTNVDASRWRNTRGIASIPARSSARLPPAVVVVPSPIERIAASAMITAAPAIAALGATTATATPPATAPTAWLSVLAMLIPDAAAVSSRGVWASVGSRRDCAGRYGAATVASSATTTRTNARSSPAATAPAAVAIRTVRAAAIRARIARR
jgi:hypothetical protein